MRSALRMLQRQQSVRITKIASLILFGLLLQGVLVLPVLRKTDAELRRVQEAEHLCLQMGRRTRSLQEFHVSRPQFDPARIQQVVEQLRQLEPKIQLPDENIGKQLLAALTGTNCSLLEHLWQDYSRQSNTIGVKSRGDFYALFLKATAKSLDPFSDFDYFNKFDQMQIPMRNAHQVLGLIALERKDHLLVNRVLPFTAAEKEGSIRAGDKIIAIEKKNGEVVKFSHAAVPLFKQYLRSQSEVVLRIRRDEGEARNRLFPVTIKKGEVPTRRAFFYVTSVAGQKVGVIKLPSFYINRFQQAAGGAYEGAAPDVLNALKALQKEKVQAILLDLRGNLGGDKDEALRILGYFLRRNVGVKIRYSHEVKSYQTLADQVYDRPFSVLINRLSASAAEIVAGAIQDYKRGLVLGENSYGKWTVQDVFLFPGFDTDEFSGSLRVTVGETMTPLEKRYPLKGMKPDILISHSPHLKDDKQLRQALQILIERASAKQ